MPPMNFSLCKNAKGGDRLQERRKDSGISCETEVLSGIGGGKRGLS